MFYSILLEALTLFLFILPPFYLKFPLQTFRKRTGRRGIRSLFRCDGHGAVFFDEASNVLLRIIHPASLPLSLLINAIPRFSAFSFRGFRRFRSETFLVLPRFLRIDVNGHHEVTLLPYPFSRRELINQKLSNRTKSLPYAFAIKNVVNLSIYKIDLR